MANNNTVEYDTPRAFTSSVISMLYALILYQELLILALSA